MPAYDTTVYFARSGLSHMLTVPGMFPPSPRPAFGDNVAGLGLAFGVMMALYSRDRTGVGQEVDTSLFASAIYQLTFDAAGALATRQDEYEYRAQVFEGTEEERRQRDELMAEARAALKRLADFQRERIPSAMSNAYETKDGRSLRVNALQSDRYWAKFCKLLGRPDLEADPKFSSKDARADNRKELYHIFREAFLTRTLDEWRPLVSDLPASPFQSMIDVIDDPQARANDFFLPYDHPVYGPMEIMASPVNLSGTPATIRSPAPEFSQDTEELLLAAGYTRDDIARFRERGVIPTTETS
jgi:crotonobetainyl-CoA:carnitine CoA-transferase CaiB-like acyl-CoA transferase